MPTVPAVPAIPAAIVAARAGGMGGFVKFSRIIGSTETKLMCQRAERTRAAQAAPEQRMGWEKMRRMTNP